MMFTLTQEQYEALAGLARQGAPSPQSQRDLTSFLATIERDNGVTRSQLWVQWQEADTPLVPTTAFPEIWPPEMRFYIELLTRPVALFDVAQVLHEKARQPVNVLVTPDPGALVGWTKLDEYFVR